MLKIRLARGGKHKTPFFRIVLTEHTKPVKSGYKEVLGWYDPLKHTIKVDVDTVKAWIAKGAQPSNRVAKLLLKETGDELFKAYITETTRVRKKKNAPEEEEAPAESPAPAPETTQEETPAPTTEVEDAPQEEATPEVETTEETPEPETNEEAPAEEQQEETPAEAEEEKQE